MVSSERGFELNMVGSAPIRKGTGASKTSIIFLGSMGMSTCFHIKGNKNDMKETHAFVNKALYFDIRRTFFSAKSAKNMSTTCSALSDLNRLSMSDLEA